MTHPPSLLTKNCCLPILFGIEVLQVFEDLMSRFIFPFESFYISSLNMYLVSVICSERIHFFLPCLFTGDPSLFFPHMILMYEILTSVTPPITSLSLLLPYCQQRFSMGKGLCRVGVLLAFIQMSSAGAGSFL